MTRESQHERLIVDLSGRYRGDRAPVSTTDPRQAQQDMDREAMMDATGRVFGSAVVW